MMETLKRCLAVAAGIMSVGLAQATTYYVSSTGSDDASGTSRDAPFATIGKAVAAANADGTAEAVVLLSDLTSAATVEITGAYTLKGDTADPAATTLSASGTVSPLVKVSNADAVVEYLTISGGTGAEKSATGGNVFLNGGGTVRYCRLVNAVGKFVYGGGAVNNNGTISHCEISGCSSTGSNSKGTHGVGIHQLGASARTEHCLICNNTANDKGVRGAGIYAEGGVITDCVISNNMGRALTADTEDGSGAGASLNGAVQLEKSLIVYNKGGTWGAGVAIYSADASVDHCTIVENIGRKSNGGGVWAPSSVAPRISNSILYYNRCCYMGGAVQNYYFVSGDKSNCHHLLMPAPVIGTDSIANRPAFVDSANGDFRISAYSNAARAASDGTDIGWYQVAPDAALAVGIEEVDGNRISITEKNYNWSAKCVNAVGKAIYLWRFDNLTTGVVGKWSDSSVLVFNNKPGLYAINVQATDESGSVATFTRKIRVCPATTYLVPEGTAGNTPAEPYDTPEKAANDIFKALDFCTKGTTLDVAPGDYGVTRTVNITSGGMIRGAGPDKTSIYRIGQYNGGTPLQVMQTDNSDAFVSGFAITNGYFATEADCKLGCNLALYKGVVSNCVIASGVFPGEGAEFVAAALSVCGGTVSDSIIRNNEGGGWNGCGVYLLERGLLSGCVISNNVYTRNYDMRGAGLNVGNTATISHCIICDNYNCRGDRDCTGGGVYADAGDFDNCLIARNTSGPAGGGGVYVGAGKTVTFKNCTIVRNKASKGDTAKKGKGGGIFVGNATAKVTLTNCILIGNEAEEADATGGMDWSGSLSANCNRLCAFTAVGSNPLVVEDITKVGFKSVGKGNFGLKSTSPCVDEGVDVGWTKDDRDVAGHSRVFNEIVDVGCYEYSPIGFLLFVR